MNDPSSPLPNPDVQMGIIALNVAFSSLGRVLLCVGPDFRIVNASSQIEEYLGPGSREALRGRPVADLLGDELFGEAGALRATLLEGEIREGWRAHLSLPQGGFRIMTVTAAPLRHSPDDPCDPRIAHLVVLRPDDDLQMTEGRGPTILSGMVARSKRMLEIFHLVENLRYSEATVLITGESGTGKEVLARAIHEHSQRSKRPFVAVNCGALPESLLESELFGHVRGAFTGATRDREGRFAVAEGGTLFLDEIAEMAPHLQVRLLRVLQEGTYEPVGSSTTRHADVRIVAATNANLVTEVEQGGFREDLYYRLRVVPIHIPPLRDRPEDIEILARRLLTRIGQRRGRSLRFSPAAVAALPHHPWPGNVRELENALEYAVALCPGQTILPEHLPADVRKDPSSLPPASPSSAASPAQDRSETAEIRAALDAHRWHRGRAAEALGMSRTTLWRKMRELGLDG